MPGENSSILQCPACRATFEVGDNGSRTCADGHAFKLTEDGVANFTYPETPTGSDAQAYEQYMQIAEQYDTGTKLLFESFFEDENTMRAELARSLEAKEGDTILEVSCGTGVNFQHLLDSIGGHGELHALDFSPAMLKVALEKAEKRGYQNIRFYLANASYLPFEDDSFDALLHVGGLNTFTEMERALDEMVRVVKPGGKVVVSDEGLAPWLL